MSITNNNTVKSRKQVLLPRTSPENMQVTSLLTPFSNTLTLLPAATPLTFSSQTMSPPITLIQPNKVQIPRLSTSTRPKLQPIPIAIQLQPVQVQPTNQPINIIVNVQKPSNKCRYCDKVFDNLEYVEPHEEKWHKKYNCKICNKVTASSQKAIDYHIKRDHYSNKKISKKKSSTATNKPVSRLPLVVVKDEEFEETEIEIIGGTEAETNETDPLDFVETETSTNSDNVPISKPETLNEFSNTINQSNMNLQQNVEQQEPEDIQQTSINEQQTGSLLQQKQTATNQQNVLNLFQNIQHLNQLPPGTLICLNPGPSNQQNIISSSSITNITAITNIVNLPPPPPVLVLTDDAKKVPGSKSRISTTTNYKLCAKNTKLRKENREKDSLGQPPNEPNADTDDTVSDSTLFVCNYDFEDGSGKCNSKFDTMIELENHSAYHTNLQIYLKYISKYSSKSKVSELYNYKCEICLSTFTKFSLFENHKFIEHQVNPNPNRNDIEIKTECFSDYDYRCVRKNCGRSFKEFNDFEKHDNFHLAKEYGLL